MINYKKVLTDLHKKLPNLTIDELLKIIDCLEELDGYYIPTNKFMYSNGNIENRNFTSTTTNSLGSNK